MIKADIVNQIVKETGVEKTTFTSVVELFMNNVKADMSKRNNVYLRGFGGFTVKTCA